MRQPAEWMVPADDRILEAVRSEGNLTPLAISKDGLIPRVGITRKYASERCRVLWRYGLLEQIDRGLYGSTTATKSYLDETLDAATLTPRNGTASTDDDSS